MPFPLESIPHMQGFLWVLMRVSVLIFLLPLFGARGVPAMWKMGLSFLLALILTPLVPLSRTYPETTPEILVGMFTEVILGLILAFVVKLAFATFQLAGQFMSFQMGFSMSRAVDPVTGTQSNSLSQFLYMFALLIFFAIDGHHLFVRALASSFYMVPPNSLTLDPGLSTILARASSQMFLIALKIAAPIMIALFLSNLCLGIVARTVPQVNILMIGFPINIGLGLILFGLILGMLAPFLTTMTRGMGEVMMSMFRLM
jgi:flagellar biosynthetic protein FliR